MAATIRLATDTDAAAVAAIYAPYVRDTPISFETDPPSADEMRDRIASTLVAYPWLVYARDGTVLGYAYAGSHRTRAAYRWSVDVSVYVDQRAHRQGIGRALYAVLLRLVPLLGYFNAYAGITLPNVSSVALHESLGFEPVGIYHRVGFKLGAWHDVGWWELTLRPHAAPATPLLPCDVEASKEWGDALESEELNHQDTKHTKER